VRDRKLFIYIDVRDIKMVWWWLDILFVILIISIFPIWLLLTPWTWWFWLFILLLPSGGWGYYRYRYVYVPARQEQPKQRTLVAVDEAFASDSEDEAFASDSEDELLLKI